MLILLNTPKKSNISPHNLPTTVRPLKPDIQALPQAGSDRAFMNAPLALPGGRAA
jgi:hypothetical protein